MGLARLSPQCRRTTPNLPDYQADADLDQLLGDSESIAESRLGAHLRRRSLGEEQ